MEEEKHRCNKCDREFGSLDSLGMHDSAKHSPNIPKEDKSGKTNYRKIRNWGIFLIIVFGIFYLTFWMFQGAGSFEDIPAEEINIGSHSNIALHMHSDLEIRINGQDTLIPANIGVSTGIMRPVHTHDSTGEIHIEGPFARDFTLGDFFKIWERNFNSTCIFDYCTDNGELKFYINGQENFDFENYILKDGENIQIEYFSDLYIT